MNFLNMFLLQAAQQQGSTWSGLLMIVLIFVIFWLFFIRPQNKRAKEQQQFRENLKKGDKIVTVGGVYGVVAEVKEQYVLMEIDNNVKIRVDKQCVVRDSTDIQVQN